MTNGSLNPRAEAMESAEGALSGVGRILLVSTYELGHQPVGLASPAAFLEAAGFTPVLLDLAVQAADPAALAHASFVGVSVPMHTALRLGLRFVAQLREARPEGGPTICFFGLYAGLNRDFLLEAGVDYVIGGEFEEALVALVHRVDQGVTEVPPGVSSTAAVSPPVVARLKYQLPSRDRLPVLDRYAKLDDGSTLRMAGHVEATRGCLHVCRHCPLTPVYNGRFFAVPVDLVMEDVRRQVAAGAQHITFGDPDFLNGPTHAVRVVERMQAEFPNVTFDCTTKVEHLLRHADLLPKFRRAGCLFITSAFESISDEILSHLAKGHTRDDEVRAIALAKDADISVRPTWIPFTPWTRRGDFVDLLRFVGDHGLVDRVAAVQYVIKLLLPPGSPLVHLDAMRPHLLGLDESSFTYRWRYADESVAELERAVDGVVRGGVAAKQSDDQIYEQLLTMVDALDGVSRVRTSRRDHVSKSPKLTEQWFCCAEPLRRLGAH